ncbi:MULTISPECIES: response regulator [Flavobacterium]|uniref:response regulator n=1 Tax=Flavobacterium TaxID=237 RepID=UPI001FCC3063|nr:MULTISPECIES: response regulator [Flavobacterium]UOK43635.1 response regulator [Flavobacterium enshiense]
MNANKPSYEELESQVNALRDQLASLSLVLSETYKGVRGVSDNLESGESAGSKSLKTELIESVLHRVKTPLNTIVGLANLLSTSKLDLEERNNFAEIIANCSSELEEVFSEFLNYNSYESQNETVTKQKVSLNNLLDELKVKFVGRVLYKGLNFRSGKGLVDRDDLVMVDGVKINHIFTSLLSNALKYTHKGFVEMGYRLEKDEIKFYVKDSGVGFDKRVIEDQLASKVTLEKVADENNNVGLGLFMVKHYVDLLGGNLEIESEPGVGTEFYFKVPYEPALADVEATASKKTIKVLIAEDEEISYMLLKKLLEKGNVEIIRAKNGEEAYEIYKNNPDINLILMDLRMPQVDGYTAAQLIKNESPEIPIIAQSAYLQNDDKENYRKAFNGYLSKPVNKEEFKAVVDKYIALAFLN